MIFGHALRLVTCSARGITHELTLREIYIGLCSQAIVLEHLLPHAGPWLPEQVVSGGSIDRNGQIQLTQNSRYLALEVSQPLHIAVG